MNKSISIVLPVYNEEDNIADAVFSLDKIMEKNYKDYEIIIVESGSTDNSREIIDKLLKKYKNLKAYYQGAKKGYGNAIREGFTKAKNELILYTDSDRPFDFNELSVLIPKIEGYDAVIGSRINRKIPPLRKLYSLGYKTLIRVLFGVKVKDVNFSFKLIRRDMLKKLNLITDGWFIDAEMLIELKKNNAKINQVPIYYTLRKKGKSNVTFKTIFGIANEIYQYKKQTKNI